MDEKLELLQPELLQEQGKKHFQHSHDGPQNNGLLLQQI
jgi:hypothetical protein